MASLPCIGITTYGRDPAGRYTLPAQYVAAVHRAGGLPILIPPGARAPAAYLDLVDGVILAGGGDIDPSHYAGAAHDKLYGVDAERDALELSLARALVERQAPTLAICRGMQMLNVALGGDLIAHLPDEVGDTVLHRAPPREPTPHEVALDPASRLAQVTGATTLRPLSWHHQAIRRVAPGLSAVAHAPDGTIEAVEMRGAPWLLAVQWHPELTAHEDPAQQRLFDALVAHIRQRRGD